MTSADPSPGPVSPDRVSPDPVAVAREICLRQLSARARSRAELAVTLSRRGVADDVAMQVLDRLTEVGLVNDGAFAAAFVSSARGGRGLGRKALEVELRRRGVGVDASSSALAEVRSEDEEETARSLVDRRLRSLSGQPPQVLRRRLVAMLIRKGYDFELAMRVVRDAIGADGSEDETDPAGGEPAE